MPGRPSRKGAGVSLADRLSPGVGAGVGGRPPQGVIDLLPLDQLAHLSATDQAAMTSPRPQLVVAEIRAQGAEGQVAKARIPVGGGHRPAKDPGAPASDGLPVGGIWNLALHQDSLCEPVDAIPEGLGIAFQ